MIRFAMGFVRTRAAAEEVVQDTWLAVIQGIAGLESRSLLTTWLYSITLSQKGDLLVGCRNATVSVSCDRRKDLSSGGVP